MKLRLRFRKLTKILTVNDELSEEYTVGNLTSAVKELFGTDIPGDFSLSLNNRDALKDESKRLSDCNIVSGDLVYIISNSDAPSPPKSSKPELLQTTTVSTFTYSQSNDNPSQSDSLSNLSTESGAPPNLPTHMETEPQAEPSTVDGAGAEIYVEEDSSLFDRVIINQCLSEPILCREASHGCIPSLLREQYHSAQPSDAKEALCVVLHVLMMETGFIHAQQTEPGSRLPNLWCQNGYFKLRYTYPGCENTNCSVTVIATGPMVVVHGLVSERQSASRQCKLRLKEYIHAVTNDCLDCYYQLPKLSRVFKDTIANPLVQDMRTAAGLEDLFGILALTHEVKLKILSCLDVRSLCRLAQVNMEFSGLCSDPYLWRRLYMHQFGNRRDNSLSQNWRQLFINEYKIRKERRKHMARIMTPSPWGPMNPFGGPSSLLPPGPAGIIGGDYDLYPNFHGGHPGMPGMYGPPLGLPRPRYDLIGPGPYNDPNAAPSLRSRRPRGGGASGRINPFAGFGPRFF